MHFMPGLFCEASVHDARERVARLIAFCDDASIV
jgi:hypothetical protein